MNTQKKMINRTAIVLVVLGAGLFCSNASATDPPPCPPCWSNWPDCDVWDCNAGEDCCDEENCETCIDNVCKVCSGDPNQVCCDGSCCDTSINCQTCVEGNCVSCGGNPNLACCDGECVSTCWYPEFVGYHVYVPCSPCFGPIEGCIGAAYIIDPPYYSVWRPAEPGESGYCKNPTRECKRKHVFGCKEVWDTDALWDCAEGIVECYKQCIVQRSPVACARCLYDLGIVDCISEGICNFVEECTINENLFDSQNVTIVDWAGDLGDTCVVPSY